MLDIHKQKELKMITEAFKAVVPILSINATNWIVTSTQLLAPILALAVSAVSFLWVLYKFKNEKRKFDREK